MKPGINNKSKKRNITTNSRIVPTRILNPAAANSTSEQNHNFVHEQNTQHNEPPDNPFSLTDSETYIFGDIEGDETLFNSTMSILESNYSDPNSRFVFLGDLYDYDKPNTTISMISKILQRLNVPIPNIFSEETKEIEIIRVYRKLWKLKQMKAYSKFNIQYLHYKLKPEHIEPFKHLFILGNKEVIFVQELIACEHISKLPDNSFSVPAEYKFKHVEEGRDPIKRTNYVFNHEELNIMHAYISNCFNFAVVDETLYIHCYINYKHFKDSINVNRVISGHSKGYGRFVDSEFPGIDIYICDLTGLSKENNQSIGSQPINYLLNDKGKIIYNYNINFKPRLDKIELNTDEDVQIMSPNRSSDSESM